MCILMSGWTKCSIFTWWDFIQPCKEWTTDTWYSMDGSWRHTKWKNQNTKGHMLYNSIYREPSEQANLQSQKVGCWLPGIWGKVMRRILKDTGFLCRVIKMFQSWLWCCLHNSEDQLKPNELYTLNNELQGMNYMWNRSATRRKN